MTKKNFCDPRAKAHVKSVGECSKYFCLELLNKEDLRGKKTWKWRVLGAVETGAGREAERERLRL